MLYTYDILVRFKRQILINYLEDMVTAIGLPKEKLCLYCWTGEYPKPKVVVEGKEVDSSVAKMKG